MRGAVGRLAQFRARTEKQTFSQGNAKGNAKGKFGRGRASPLRSRDGSHPLRLRRHAPQASWDLLRRSARSSRGTCAAQPHQVLSKLPKPDQQDATAELMTLEVTIIGGYATSAVLAAHGREHREDRCSQTSKGGGGARKTLWRVLDHFESAHIGLQHVRHGN